MVGHFPGSFATTADATARCGLRTRIFLLNLCYGTSMKHNRDCRRLSGERRCCCGRRRVATLKLHALAHVWESCLKVPHHDPSKVSNGMTHDS
jgi:hypothetical protein